MLVNYHQPGIGVAFSGDCLGYGSRRHLQSALAPNSLYNTDYSAVASSIPVQCRSMIARELRARMVNFLFERKLKAQLE